MSKNIEGNVGDDSKQVAIGEHNRLINIYADSHTWRLEVQERFYALYRQIDELRGWVRGLLIAFCVVSFVMLVVGLFALRQFDLQAFKHERTIDRVERLEQRVIPPPVPFTPIP